MPTSSASSVGRSLFPLIFVSVWLLAFYQRTLQPGRRDRGALPLLLKSWWLGPRAIPLAGAQRSGPRAYSVNLDEDFCSDEMGRSTLLLLEDGKPLPYPHATSMKKIAAEGGGRWVHVGRKLIFSASDNADLAKAPHQYHLLDGLGSQPELFGALSKLAQLRATFRNPAAYACAKLQLTLGERLAVGKVREIDANNLAVEDLRLDLASAFLPDLSIARGVVEVVTEDDITRILAELESLHWGDMELDALRLELTIDAGYRPRLIALSGARAGQTLVDLTSAPSRGEWQSASLIVNGLGSLRHELAAICGGPQAAVSWLDALLADLASDTLGMRLKLSDDTRATLATALADTGQAHSLALDLIRAGAFLDIAARTQ